METYKCKICGRQQELKFDWYKNATLKKRSICCNCLLYEPINDEHNFAIINGRIWILSRHQPPTERFRGCGGAWHKIRFNDGSVKYNDNLWHVSDILPHMRGVMPDNARFEELTKEEIDNLEID